MIVATLAFAVPALAADVIYYNGFLTDGTAVSGPRHSLTNNSVRKLGRSSTAACVQTTDANRNLDSEARCTSVQNGVASHAFCGCKLRYPIVFTGSGGGGTDLRARLEY
jgi:hypothetical protein